MDEIEAPSFPGFVDWSKVSKGLKRYNQICSQCHGTILRLSDRADDFTINPKDKLLLNYDMARAKLPFKIIKTDRAFWDSQAKTRHLAENILSNKEAKSIGLILESPRASEEPFIYAPPLISVWATAPYLHNGSVPTVFDVLDNGSRPTYWQADPDPHAYDDKNLGLKYNVLSKFEMKTALSKRNQPEGWLLYDTTNKLNGMSNVGHKLKKILTKKDIYEIIEFLKILDSHRVKPKYFKNDFDWKKRIKKDEKK